GGMGIVYKGKHIHLNRITAIKILPPDFSFDPQFIKRFRREAISAASLDHPNIVRIYDTGVEKNINYIAMEFIDGTNLDEILKKEERLPLNRTIDILTQVADALDYAHKKMIIHRDVKPSNILINKMGKAYLTDFGIAKALDGMHLTRTASSIGTPEYMSPEQIEGKEITYKADIYSLGAVAFKMLTGVTPFSGNTTVAIFNGHLNKPVPSVTQFVEELPKWLDPIIVKAMAKDASKRYIKAIDMIEDLKRGMAAHKFGIAFVQEKEKLDKERLKKEIPQVKRTKIVKKAKKKKGKGWLLVAGAVVLLLVLAVGFLFISKNKFFPLTGKMGSMVKIPAGEFLMGSNSGLKDELPVHKVMVDKFFIDKYEVTNQDFCKFLNAKGNQKKGGVYWINLDINDRIIYKKGKFIPKKGYENHPVVAVSWYGAKAYATWAGKRLPTEAEWEKAARGGMIGKRFPWGDNIDKGKANYLSDDTSPVGSYPPNGYGLYDMAGNVWEWCNDWYQSDYYKHSPYKNPQGPNSGTFKVMRGGSWGGGKEFITVSRRGWSFPETTNIGIGFRCAK
ncbi:MAG: SUMF1/EgtB/PvdO family nonheme iron enzyme, partial [Deltaproteobacteria bacterium]|nr:SUMF1/EgtB/PvdO family nonheme iron enzyme [Deltaproteobacteria bacterium]